MGDAVTVNIAEAIHDQMAGNPTRLYETDELRSLDPRAGRIEVALSVINYLLSQGLVKALSKGGKDVFKYVAKDIAERQAGLSADERLLFSHIENSGTEGIWTKTLKVRSNLHPTTITKCLKSLENKRFIKCIKSVKHPTRKIYMLYELQPSIDVSGGPWFTDGELDDEFVNTLSATIEKFVESKSYPKPSSAPYPPDYTGYPTLETIHKLLKRNAVTDVDLTEADIKSLLDCLVYDGRLERVANGTAYRCIRRASEDSSYVSGFTEAPCGRCPVFSLCEEGGPVNAKNCVYYAEWLNAAI